jgi:hypothetical protein
MTLMEYPWATMAIPRVTPLQCSRSAEALARWASFCYWISLHFAVLSLLMAAAFALLTPEPLWMRIASFGFLGVLPALAGFSIGQLTCWILKGASAIYDPVALFFRRVFRAVTNNSRIGWLFVLWLATGLLPRCVRFVVTVVRACWLAGGRATASALASCTWFLRLIARALIGVRAAILTLAGACAAVASVCWRTTTRMFGKAYRYSSLAGRALIISATYPVRLLARLLIRLGEQGLRTAPN